MRTKAYLVALLLISALVPIRSLAAQNRSPIVFAVVVGHNDGWGLLPKLHYADDDALRFYRLITQLTSPKHVALLTELDVETWRRLQLENRQPPAYLPPTKDGLKQVIKLFKTQIAKIKEKDPDRVVHLYFFFSGHGEKGYFFLKKDRFDSLEKGAFTARDLETSFADSKASLNGLFIDACKSQSLFVQKGGNTKDDKLGPDFSKLIAKVEKASKGKPIGVLTSTLADRPAGEASTIGSGYFSHALISGLAGAADADSDGVIRYGELVSFVSFHTKRVSGQTPWFRPPKGRFSAPLIWLKERKNLLAIAPGISGHFAIFDAKTGRLRFEVHKTRAQWARFILEKGDYRVVWVRSRTMGLMAKVHMSGTEKSLLMKKDFQYQTGLARYRLNKGKASSKEENATSIPSSLPTSRWSIKKDLDLEPDRVIASFDPALSGFTSAFSPKVVELVETAYLSGINIWDVKEKEESDLENERNHHLSFVYGGLQTTTDDEEWAQSFGLAYEYHREHFSLGGRALYNQFSSGKYYGKIDIYRIILQSEASVRFRILGELYGGLGLYAGWQGVFILSKNYENNEYHSNEYYSVLTGDILAFRLGVHFKLSYQLTKKIFIDAAIAYGGDYIRQANLEGKKNYLSFYRPSLLGGIGYAF